MATGTFNVATDMRTFAGYDFGAQEGSGGITGSTSTEFNFRTNAGFYYIITGTDLSGSILPYSGTVTGWDFGQTQEIFNPADPFNPTTHDFSYWTFTGLSVPADEFSNAIDGSGADLAAYMPTMLAGNDTINGSAYNDYLLGYDGNDTLKGNGGDDGLDGGAGNDVLSGGAGKDTMIGGTGNDTYFVENGGDRVIEYASEGTDLVKSSISYTLGANVENLTLTGTAAIYGYGNSGNNVITGNSGANKVSGGAGNDTIYGGGGNDIVVGGTGNDTLTGGSGADQFLFNAALNATTNHDKIVDFSVADDTIALDQTYFGAIASLGTLNSNAFFTGAAAHDSDDRIIYDSASGNIYYDPDGNGSHAQILFAHVTAGTVLTNADFLIVA